MNHRLIDAFRRNASPVEVDHIESYAQGRISRRQFVTRGSVLGLSLPFMSAIVAACGGDSEPTVKGTTG
jgi:peptide/nickel transport system substrate-binding protein